MTPQDLLTEIRARLETLGHQVESAKASEEVLGYLKFLASFHQYSLNNTLSIWFHRPTATHVAGLHTWRKLGRLVKAGERGIPILAPCASRTTEEESRGTCRPVTHFRLAYVFDVSQTHGEPLHEAPITVCGDGRGLLPLLESLAQDKGLAVSYVPLHGDHHGSAYADGRVEVAASLDDAGRASVLCHELAHSLCHFGLDRAEMTQQQRELEAEVTSYVVTTHFGLASKAPEYLALWGVEKGEVMASFKRIHAVAAQLIKALEALTGTPTVSCA